MEALLQWTILEIFSGNDPEYDSDDINCYAPPRMCYHIDGEVLVEEAPGLTPPDQSPLPLGEGGSPAGLAGGPCTTMSRAPSRR